jgi:hypothetical protein
MKFADALEDHPYRALPPHCRRFALRSAAIGFPCNARMARPDSLAALSHTECERGVGDYNRDLQ